MTDAKKKPDRARKPLADGKVPAPSSPKSEPALGEPGDPVAPGSAALVIDTPPPAETTPDPSSELVEEEVTDTEIDGFGPTGIDRHDDDDEPATTIHRRPFWARWFDKPKQRATERLNAAVTQTHEGHPPVVLFAGVSKTYGLGTDHEVTAIKDVSFTVEDLPDKGEFVAILGPSGCGKSTVLRLIAGLEPQHPQTSGRIEVLGERIKGPGADRGMVFQSYTSFDHRTVLHNVAFGLECRGMRGRERLAEARRWIEKVGLSVKDDAGKYPHQLSGGMQQRVAIARSLILKPRIILMDEPFGALDPITRMHMQDLLVALWREVEATVFFVTHSIEEAVYLGDRVYIFSPEPGTITREVEVPPPERPAIEMQRDPQFQEVVFEIRNLIDKLEQEARRQRGEPPAPAAGPARARDRAERKPSGDANDRQPGASA